jgi:hypothetical protein
MALGSDLRIAVLPGDGIGVEVMDACIAVLDALYRTHAGPGLHWNKLAGAPSVPRDGTHFRTRPCGKPSAPMLFCSGQWACLMCATPMGPRSRRNWISAFSSNCSPACARSVRSRACLVP